MAIPFYEKEEQHQVSEEIDQVDGPIMHAPSPAQNQGLSNQESYQTAANQQNLIVWKILAIAMCKALKDHYQLNIINSTSPVSASNSSSSSESATAVIQILPNGQVKPQWN